MKTILREAIEALHLIAGGNESEVERPLHEIVDDGLATLMQSGVSAKELAEGIFDRDALEELLSESTCQRCGSQPGDRDETCPNCTYVDGSPKF